MLSNKKLEKVEKILGEDVIADILQSSEDELKNVIVKSSAAIKTAQEELEANPKYQELKENLKSLSLSFKDVKKFQKAKIDYCLNTLEVLDHENETK